MQPNPSPKASALHANGARPTLVAKWADDRRWQAISRSRAAEMLRANRRHFGARVYRYSGELHIENRDVHFVIAKATEHAS